MPVYARHTEETHAGSTGEKWEHDCLAIVA